MCDSSERAICVGNRPSKIGHAHLAHLSRLPAESKTSIWFTWSPDTMHGRSGSVLRMGISYLRFSAWLLSRYRTSWSLSVSASGRRFRLPKTHKYELCSIILVSSNLRLHSFTNTSWLLILSMLPSLSVYRPKMSLSLQPVESSGTQFNRLLHLWA